ncbi:transcriptional regulatory [Fusarium beomiforme]|uniref:Transcriptional regulatory n=1 Tax=Fusarium beomiforme TaxID=44412 RepID=A0A9P5E1A8_9HYPO|nr:transcriptional regulatory [Fusarium beomiforme]
MGPECEIARHPRYARNVGIARPDGNDSGPSSQAELSIPTSSASPVIDAERHDAAQLQRHMRPGPTLSSASMSTPKRTSQLDLGISKQTVKQHIDAYFDLIHPIPCYGFLHRATVLQSWSKSELNPCLLSAICGITSRFINPSSSEHRNIAKKWIDDAESQLLLRLSQPRLSDIEAWLLVTLDHYLSQRVSKMLVSMALTSRLAYILRLNHEDPRHKFLVQERRRRLMWAIYIMDSLHSSGKAEFTACTTDTLHIQLPCSDKSFSMDIPVTTVLLHCTSDEDASHVGLLGYCIRVLDIRNRVHRLTLMITNHRKPIDECLSEVDSIENELRQFSVSLPSRYHLDPSAFSLRAFSPSRTPFLMLHAWWHQTHCDLFRFTIPGFREGLPTAEILQLSPQFAVSSREKCLYHAVSVSKILEIPKEVGGSELISDPSIAMCAFHSARIISRLGQYPMGDMPQPELVARLTACSEALQEQAAILPTTAILMKGINDLVNDAQRDRHGPFTYPSIWEEEESESNRAAGISRPGGGERGVREIFSKHSVTETAQNLEFQHGEQQDSGDQHEPAQAAPDVQFATPSRSLSGLDSDFVPMHISPLPGSVNQDQTDFGLYLGDTGTHMDCLFNFGLHGQYGSGQPDVFMDSFWPLADGDWTMPDVGDYGSCS